MLQISFFQSVSVINSVADTVGPGMSYLSLLFKVHSVVALCSPEVKHMFKKWQVTLLVLQISKILRQTRFIFFYMCVSRPIFSSRTRMGLTMFHKICIAVRGKCFIYNSSSLGLMWEILLCNGRLKMTPLNNELRWSHVARGRLCWKRKFVIIISVLKTFLFRGEDHNVRTDSQKTVSLMLQHIIGVIHFYND